MQAPTQMISVQIILKYLTLPASLALLHRRTQSKSLCGPILNEDALPPSPLSYIGATFLMNQTLEYNRFCYTGSTNLKPVRSRDAPKKSP